MHPYWHANTVDHWCHSCLQINIQLLLIAVCWHINRTVMKETEEVFVSAASNEVDRVLSITGVLICNVQTYSRIVS